jgi:hypothetical protein
MNIMQIFDAITTETLAARARLNDKRISTQVKAGKGIICTVEYAKGGRSIVVNIGEWIPVAELPAALGVLKCVS